MLKFLRLALFALGLTAGAAVSPSHAADVGLAPSLVQQVQYYPPRYVPGPRYGYHGPRRFHRPPFYHRRFHRPHFHGPRFHGRGYYGRHRFR